MTALQLTADEIAAVNDSMVDLMPPEVADLPGCLERAGVSVEMIDADRDVARGRRSLVARRLVSDGGGWAPEFEQLMSLYYSIDRGFSSIRFDRIGVWAASVHGNDQSLIGHISDPSGIHGFIPGAGDAWSALVRQVVDDVFDHELETDDGEPVAQPAVVKLMGYRSRGDEMEFVNLSLVRTTEVWELADEPGQSVDAESVWSRVATFADG